MGPLRGFGFVAAIIFMVMFHEFGHFITAKRYGMKVTEFFFGFGPRLWFVRRGETDYGVKPFPLGGYVKIVGMNPLEEIPPEEEHRTFRGKPAGQKLVVLAAGSTTHFITGLLLLFLAFTVVGYQGDALPVLEEVVAATPDRASPAAAAGLRPGDRIVAVNGTPVTTWPEVSSFIASHAGQQVTFGIVRDGQRTDVPVTLGEREGRGFLGVVAARETVRDAPHTGLWNAAQSFWRVGRDGVLGLFKFFAPSSL